MFPRILDFLSFLNNGIVWTIALVCLLRFCKRIEPAAVLRLVTPLLFLLAGVAILHLFLLLDQFKEATIHHSWSGLLPVRESRFHHAAWGVWLEWAAALVPMAFFCTAVRRNFCVVTAIATFVFVVEHYPYLASLVHLPTK